MTILLPVALMLLRTVADVTLPDGTVVNNPLRVLAHPDGAEVVFSVRQLGMTDEEFDRDCAAVAADLASVKDLLR